MGLGFFTKSKKAKNGSDTSSFASYRGQQQQQQQQPQGGDGKAMPNPFDHYNLYPQSLNELREIAGRLMYVRLAVFAFSTAAMIMFSVILSNIREFREPLLASTLSFVVLDDSVSSAGYAVAVGLLGTLWAAASGHAYWFLMDPANLVTPYNIVVARLGLPMDLAFGVLFLSSFSAAMGSVLRSTAFVGLVDPLAATPGSESSISALVKAGLAMLFLSFLLAVYALPLSYMLWKHQDTLKNASQNQQI